MRVKSTAPTINDVAKRAFVSASTVSHVLNGSRFVEEETRQRVIAVAAELGYRPSSIARSLATRRTLTVGVMVRSLSDLWMTEVVPPIEARMREAGYSVFIRTHQGLADTEREVLRVFRDRRVDGIVGLSARLGEEYGALQAAWKIPIVLVGPAVETSHSNAILWDDATGARAATEHLLALGHRRIGFLGHVGNPPGFMPSKTRLEAFRAVLVDAGISLDPALVVPGNRLPDGGLEAMQQLLGLPQPPTAVFCFNDLSALGALRAVSLSGRRVPQDISIVGFDDLALARFILPPLTTVRVDMEGAGDAAARMLLNLMSQRQTEGPLKLATKLVVRESTASVPL